MSVLKSFPWRLVGATLVSAMIALASPAAIATTIDLDGTWYAGANAGPPTVTAPNSNSFTFGDATSSANGGALWTYFDPQSLTGDGSSVEVSFGLTYNDAALGNNDTSLRFGLYDHNDGTVEMNLSANNVPAMEPARGYWTGISKVTNPPRMYARTDDATSNSPSSSGGLASYDDGDLINVGGNLLPNVEHSMAFRITRVDASTYETTVTVNGEVASAPTTDIVASDFNAFYLLNTGGNQVDSMTFNNVQVTTIPEPATFGLMLLGGVAGLLPRRR